MNQGIQTNMLRTVYGRFANPMVKASPRPLSMSAPLKMRPPLKSWPNDFLPFEWNRPEKIPGYFRGGDQEGLTPYEPQAILPEFSLSQELKSASVEDIIRKVYTFDFLSRKDIRDHRIKEYLNRLGLFHSEDMSNSLEARIVYFTWLIRNIQEVLRLYPEERKLRLMKTSCNNLIQKRAESLTKLKELHLERYQKITEMLKIDHETPAIGQPYQRIERKRELRRLTKEYCDELREKKVNDFIDSIKKDQEEFEKEKQQVTAWIKEQEEFLGITVTDNPS